MTFTTGSTHAEHTKVLMSKIKLADQRSDDSRRRRQALLELVQAGVSISDAIRDARVSVSMSAYSKWRQRDREFAAQVDIARAGMESVTVGWDGTRTSFAAHYFGMQYAAFQLMFLDEIDRMPPGNIVMCLWPPEHGKTTTYENYASQELAVNPNTRLTVASENLTIAKKIVGRIRNRMEPSGPFKDYVRQFGPFKPPSGQSRQDAMAQPWTSTIFNVYKKHDQDERDYSMMALGQSSSIVSTRCDHLHIDDIQSLKTLNKSAAIEGWFRQDALSRPGEHGKTSIVGTRVGEDDIYERIADDEDLDGILKVIKFKAIMTDYTDPANPVERPLWPERYTLDNLDRQRRKVGPEAWDRNYMQNPGASRKDAVFLDEHIDPCKNEMRSLHHLASDGSVVYIGLDPALGGVNCVIACELGEKKLIVRAIRERDGLRTNEQIMQELNQVVFRMNTTARVTDVVVEAMNFQRGLSRDERLMDMKSHYGFAVREHLTGLNKYDEDIGVASMVTSFIKGEIELPWADDDMTRNEIGELIRQLKAWKPKARGSKLRQDRVMALWFIWILWRNRWKSTDVADTADGFKRHVPWRGTQMGLIIPVGARV